MLRDRTPDVMARHRRITCHTDRVEEAPGASGERRDARVAAPSHSPTGEQPDEREHEQSGRPVEVHPADGIEKLPRAH